MEREIVFLGMSSAELWLVSVAFFLVIGGFTIARISGEPKNRK